MVPFGNAPSRFLAHYSLIVYGNDEKDESLRPRSAVQWAGLETPHGPKKMGFCILFR